MTFRGDTAVVVLAAGAAAVLAAGAVAVLAVLAANAGAAMTETASSAAEMVLNMVVSSSWGSRGSAAGWPTSLIMQATLATTR